MTPEVKEALKKFRFRKTQDTAALICTYSETQPLRFMVITYFHNDKKCIHFFDNDFCIDIIRIKLVTQSNNPLNWANSYDSLFADDSSSIVSGVNFAELHYKANYFLC